MKSKKYPNATSLSGQFEISLKTAQRDIEFMRDRLNCPLVYDKSRKGYFYEDDTFSLPMIYLSSEELSSLLIARKFLQDISEGYVGDEIFSVVQKITAILKKHMAEENLIDDALSFQLIEYSPEEIFKGVLEGCLNRKSLNFKYYSPAYEDATMRIVDPYHLLNYMGTWHLIAYCHTRKDLRNFVFGRMSDLKIIDQTFTIPVSFNIKEYLQSAFGIHKGKSIKQVTLRFSPLKSRWIAGQIWHKDQKVKFLKDGSLELTFPVANCIKVFPDVPGMYENLGEAYFEHGWIDDAKKVLEEGLKKFPDDERLKEVLKKIEDETNDPDNHKKPPLIGIMFLLSLILNRIAKKN